ncbi:MAG: preprotein translocase subunit SecA [Myxococcota bacterium]|nr:preprotein translocase subunit SecA [Myxococcota bacterium]
MKKMIEKVFGTRSDRVIRRLKPAVAAINRAEESFRALSDDELRAQTAILKERVENGAPLESVMVPAFATVREAGRRILDMRHYDVQLMGGLVLHEGKIAEMRTGEGKTLVATLPMYLNALAGKGTHLVTVNDYLATRDAEWMGRIYQWLGLSVGIITAKISDQDRRNAYECDITYGTNNEFGFDYLRDNMKFAMEEMVQRPLNFGIVDEVDSILIDEARTPLIISGPAELNVDIYYQADRVIPKLRRDLDYIVDERSRAVTLTEQGVVSVERGLGVRNLYEMEHIELLHHVNQALRAHTVYRRDVDYVIQGNEVTIVDEFTGRLMDGRRWSDGLHQAVEVKEGVPIQRENITLATITFQNYFRMYEKLGGMTGTAETERDEFVKTYGMDVTVIPTNRPIARLDKTDLVYRTEREKFDAICDDIESRNSSGQPVLVGTVSVERSEVLARHLGRRGIKHTVLNAKHHSKESQIVAQAGRLGGVTIATNMAGRGTDILLGGNPDFLARERVSAALSAKVTDQAPADPGDYPWLNGPAELIEAEGVVAEMLVDAENPEDPVKAAQAVEFVKSIIADYDVEREKAIQQLADEKQKVLDAGGLHILGTERHESRRIDNQLRGRAGRQGDPGSSQFYLSLEDDLMRRFGGEKLAARMQMFGMKEGEVIDSRMVTKQIEGAQRRVEAFNYGIRKNLLEMDDVMNQQRATLYKLRREVLSGDTLPERIKDLVESLIINLVNRHCPMEQIPGDWNLDHLEREVFEVFDLPVTLAQVVESEGGDPQRAREAIGDLLYTKVARIADERQKNFGDESYEEFCQTFYLRSIDHHWKDHLTQMDHLKEGIYLRGYGQKDPKHEYRKEGFTLFLAMLDRIGRDALGQLFHVKLIDEETIAREEEARRRRARQQMHAGSGRRRERKPRQRDRAFTGKVVAEAGQGTVRRETPKVGRNAPCPCGSGKKYKNCCGRPGAQATEA